LDFVALHAQSNPDAVAQIEGDRYLTWRELLERRNRLANALVKQGVGRSEHVIIYAPNSLEYLLASAATRAANAVPIPMNHRLVADEVRYILEHSDAVAAFVGGPYVAMAEEVRRHAVGVRLWITLGSERRPWAASLDELLEVGSAESPAVDPAQGLGGSMIYTGGTTGKPKGALRAASDAQTTLAFMQALGMMHDHHAHLVAGPLYHSAPGSFSLFAALLGGTVVVMPRFDPEQALHLIQKHRITSTFMAPTLIKRIVDLPESVLARYDVASMRSLIVAAAPCPMRVKEAALAYFGPCLYEFYGSTELGINTILRPEDVLRKPGSCGRAAPNIEIALLDDDGRPVPTGEPGEVYVRRFGGMFDAYYKNSEATRQTERGGWHSVGDVAWVDAEGFYTLCDRKRGIMVIPVFPLQPPRQPLPGSRHRNDQVQSGSVRWPPVLPRTRQRPEHCHRYGPARSPLRNVH